MALFAYPLVLPLAPQFKSVKFTANSVVAMSQSPYSGGQQLYHHPGSWWLADVVMPPMQRDPAENWIGTLMALHGQTGTFYLGDPLGKNPRGTPLDSQPLVYGPGQTGYQLYSRNWPANTNVLLKGDWIQIETQLYKMAHRADSDANGVAELDVWPRIRIAPQDGAAILYTNTVGIFRLRTNQPSFEWVEPRICNISFSAMEAF